MYTLQSRESRALEIKSRDSLFSVQKKKTENIVDRKQRKGHGKSGGK